MAKEKIELNAPWLRISIGYKKLVLPWEQGVQVFNALKDVRFVDSDYRDGKCFWKNGAEEVTCSIFTIDEQAQLLMEGENHGATD